MLGGLPGRAARRRWSPPARSPRSCPRRPGCSSRSPGCSARTCSAADRRRLGARLPARQRSAARGAAACWPLQAGSLDVSTGGRAGVRGGRLDVLPAAGARHLVARADRRSAPAPGCSSAAACPAPRCSLTVLGPHLAGWPGALLAQPAAWTVPTGVRGDGRRARWPPGAGAGDVGRTMVRLHAPERAASRRSEVASGGRDHRHFGAARMPLGAPCPAQPHGEADPLLRSRQKLPSTATQEVLRDQQRDRPYRTRGTRPPRRTPGGRRPQIRRAAPPLPGLRVPDDGGVPQLVSALRPALGVRPRVHGHQGRRQPQRGLLLRPVAVRLDVRDRLGVLEVRRPPARPVSTELRTEMESAELEGRR